jgi:hypothetical protein
MKAFFVLDKWCAANKNWGPSAWETNFVTSYESLKKFEFSSFHFDEFHDKNPGKSANQGLIDELKNQHPDFIFLVLYKKPGKSDLIISIESLAKIRDELNIPIVTIFGDLEHQEQEDIVRTIEPYMTLILYTALTAPGVRIKSPKMKYIFAPKDPAFFYGDLNVIKKTEICYYGSSKPERVAVIDYLALHSVPITLAGGEREQNIPVMTFADRIRETKICLSFSRAARCHMSNARTVEVISCNSMLLEQAGMETPKLLIPFQDFIPFLSLSDCADKAKYFLRNDAEREEISNNGFKKYQTLFSSERFWMNIIQYLEDLKMASGLNKNNRVIKKMGGEQFWLASLSERGIPEISNTSYLGFPCFYRVYYPSLNRLMESPIFYFGFRVFRFIVDLVTRVLNKIKRIITNT